MAGTIDSLVDLRVAEFTSWSHSFISGDVRGVSCVCDESVVTNNFGIFKKRITFFGSGSIFVIMRRNLTNSTRLDSFVFSENV